MTKEEIQLVVSSMYKPAGLTAAGKGVKAFAKNTVGAAKRAYAAVANLQNAFAALAVFSVAKSFLDPAIEMETFETQFETLLGSLDAAKARLKDLSDFAAATPFELPQLAQASRVLQTLTGDALSSGSGLRMVGDVSASVSAPVEELSIWFGRLYDGIQNKRKVGEPMARLQELGVVSGKTRAEIEELQKANASGAEVWAVVTRAMEKYNGGMEKLAQTTAGKLSTLRDNWKSFRREVGEGAIPALNDALATLNETLADFVASGRLAEIAAQLEVLVSAAGRGAVVLYTIDQAARKFMEGTLVGNPLGGLKAAFEELETLLDRQDARLAKQEAKRKAAAASASGRGSSSSPTGPTPATGSTSPQSGDADLDAFTERFAEGTRAAADFIANGEDPDEAGREAFRAAMLKTFAAADELAKLERDLIAARADEKAAALRDAQRDELDQLREHADKLEAAATAAAKKATDAWDALLNPKTSEQKRADHDAQRKEAKLERSLAKARAKQADGGRLNKRSKALIAADDERQAAADLGIRAAAEGDHFRADQAAFLAPPLPAAPTGPGSSADLLAALNEIKANTAAMATQGIL